MKISNYLIDILPLSLLILFFYGAKPVKPLRSLDIGGYLSIDSGKSYRGFFAVTIVLHHLSAITQTGKLFSLFSIAGRVTVAFFSFLSGYGLQKSYITKGDRYKKGYLLKRIPSVLIPYIIITAVFWLMHFVFGKSYSLKDIILLLVKGEPLVDYSWYIISILIFYLVYWGLMQVCGKRYPLMIVLGTVWYFLHIAFCKKMGYGNWWYNTSHLIIVGMFWATYETRILEILKKNYVWIASAVLVLFALVSAYRESINQLGSPFLSEIIIFFRMLLFVLCVILFSLKVQIGNRVLRFLGSISLEIYLSQGLFINLLRSRIKGAENEWLWCSVVLICTILFSYIFHIAVQFILKKYKKICVSRIS